MLHRWFFQKKDHRLDILKYHTTSIVLITRIQFFRISIFGILVFRIWIPSIIPLMDHISCRKTRDKKSKYFVYMFVVLTPVIRLQQICCSNAHLNNKRWKWFGLFCSGVLVGWAECFCQNVSITVHGWLLPFGG